LERIAIAAPSCGAGLLSTAARRVQSTRDAESFAPDRFDPLDPATIADPFPCYRWLREHAPVQRNVRGMWTVARYDDVRACLHDPRFGSSPSRFSVIARRRRDKSVAAQAASCLLPLLDPPEHTRLRRLVAQVLGEQRVGVLRPRIRAIVAELLGPARDGAPVDIVADLAAQLPLRVIGEMLAVPPADLPQLKRWAGEFFGIFAPLLDDTAHAQLTEAVERFSDYMRNLIAQRRRAPGADALSALIAAHDSGDRLSEQELVVTALLLFTNGEEALTCLLGNLVWALVQAPAQLARLHAEPALARAAVEEALRYDTPAQIVGRTVQQDLVLAGATIRAGEPVYLLLGSANRDPLRFHDPDRYDIGRLDGGHFGFGGGPHACLGAGIARAEALAALEGLLACGGRWEPLTERPGLRATLFARGLENLPMVVRPGR
jgi:cytochrome P450